MRLRRERSGDEDAVRRVHTEAFGRPDEAAIVDAIRAAGAVSGAWVAEVDGVVVGHVLFSPVWLVGAGVREGVGLAPVAVLPALHGRGIGGALIREGLAALQAEGARFAVVLGSPAWYPRFGFVPSRLHGVAWETPGAGDAFMVQELVPEAVAGGGVVHYRPELGGTPVEGGGDRGYERP